MVPEILKIGVIAYANLFPIFYMLQKESDCSGYEFIEGVPSELNRMIRQGLIDISPSSSIEYLRNSTLYDLVDNHSVSSKGPVRSIFLFSRKPLEALGGATVMTSLQSETSVAMLMIILKKFYGLECSFSATSQPIHEVLDHHKAYLLIGDDALRQALRWPDLYKYDLGDLWYRNTGLPAIFALWIIRKGLSPDKSRLAALFLDDLARAKESAIRNLSRLYAVSPLRDVMSEAELYAYWRGISYDFGDDHKKGLELFRSYATELGLI